MTAERRKEMVLDERDLFRDEEASSSSSTIFNHVRRDIQPLDIVEIIDNNGGDRGGLISLLQAIQFKYRYLPKEALQLLAERTGQSLVDIYGVATFFKSFSFTPRGRHLVSVCLGTACHVRGAPRIAEVIKSALHIDAGETTADGEFTLETVNCLGACALGPVVVVDGRYFPSVSTAGVGQIIDRARAGFDPMEIEKDWRVFPVEVSCSKCNHSLMDYHHPIDGSPSIGVTVSFGEKHGRLRLSCLYGSYHVESDHEMPLYTIAHFFCPECHAELIGSMSCPECSAPMVPMIVRGGGMVQICSRRGCKGHMLDLG